MSNESNESNFYKYENEFTMVEDDQKLMNYDDYNSRSDEYPSKKISEVIGEFKEFLKSMDLKNKWLVFSRWTMCSSGLSEGVSVAIYTETCDISPVIKKALKSIRDTGDCYVASYDFGHCDKTDKTDGEADKTVTSIYFSIEDQKRPYGFEIKIVEPIFPLKMSFKAASDSWSGPY